MRVTSKLLVFAFLMVVLNNEAISAPSAMARSSIALSATAPGRSDTENKADSVDKADIMDIIRKARESGVCDLSCRILAENASPFHDVICFYDGAIQQFVGCNRFSNDKRNSLLFWHRCHRRKADEYGISFTDLCEIDTAPHKALTSSSPNYGTRHYTAIDGKVVGGVIGLLVVSIFAVGLWFCRCKKKPSQSWLLKISHPNASYRMPPDDKLGHLADEQAELRT